MALTVTRLDTVGTFARISVPWAVFISFFSTVYILGCLYLAVEIGKTDTDQKTLDNWLRTASQNGNKGGPGEGKERELVGGKASEGIAPHETAPYVIPATSFLCSTLLPALLSLRHPHHPRSFIHTPLVLYRPYTTTSAKPSLSFWAVGVLGLLFLDILKTVVAHNKKRESWPTWKQAAFYVVFYSISVAWVLMGSGIIHGTVMRSFSLR